MIPSLLRLAEHNALAKISLSGKVLDLGGVKRSEYSRLIKGDHSVTIVNLDTGTQPDVIHDLEQPLPFPDASYDHVLLINVLEHVYHYRQLLDEASRVIHPGGTAVIVVPFFFPIHPSPHDYWRFTAETLRKECEHAGLTVQAIVPLGTGVFSARYLAIDRLMPIFIRFISYYSLRYLALALDVAFARFAQFAGKKYQPSDYPLGYVLTAVKSA